MTETDANSDGAARSIGWSAARIAAFYLIAALPMFVSETIVTPATLLATVVLGGSLVALSAIDLATMRLPDAITLPLAAIGLIFAFALGTEAQLFWHLAAAAGGYLTIWALARGYEAVRGRAGIGLGDAKLLAAAGAWLGLAGLPTTLVLACAGALLFVAVRAVAGRPVGAAEPLPFGPFLAIGIWFVWLYGPLV